MALRLGLDCILYRNTGTYAAPVWDPIPNVKDVTLSVESAEADVTTRANNGWKATVATLKEASIEYEAIWDTADADFTAVQNAFFNKTPLEFAVMDGPITVSGNQGLRATCSVLKFSRKESLTEAVMVSITIKPTYAANAPSWYSVP